MNGVFMLTDEEKSDLVQKYYSGPISVAELVAKVERAVLAKAGDQEPAIVVKGGKVVGINPAQGTRIEGEFYAHPLPAQAIPEGYALAPLEPTDAMIDAGVAMALQVSVHGKGGWSKYITGLYKQMIAARPKF